MLQLKDVTISYKNEPTVEHFNLNMKQGQIVSLVGESGSGKTTVIRAILGLLAGGGKVSEGSVLFENQDLLSYTNEQWRKLRGTQISMIFQDSGAMMNPTRKVGKVFTEYILTHEKISKKEAWAKGCEMLGRMNLASPDNVMNSYPFQLSGGMRQRVMIAIALSANPEILIADERLFGEIGEVFHRGDERHELEYRARRERAERAAVDEKTVDARVGLAVRIVGRGGDHR